MNPLTQQGIAAYKAGNKAEARRLLRQALQQDATDIPAWLCLSGATDEAADQAYCFQMVLRLDPGNAIARKGMTKIDQDRKQAAVPQDFRQDEAPAMPDFRAELLYNHTPPFTGYPSGADEPRLQQPARTARPEPEPIPAPAVQELRWPEPEPVAPPAPALKAEPVRAARAGQRRPPAKTKRAPAKKSSFKPWMWAALGGMALLILMTTFAFVAVILNQPKTGLVAPISIAATKTPLPTATATPGFPPTYTPTASPSPRPTRTPTPTATYMVLGPTIVHQMTNIQKEVSDLRGLPIQSEVPGFIVTKPQAEELLRGLYITGATRAELENEKRALVIIGLVKPTYDLVNLALNHLVDNIGGFYLPEQKQMYVLAALRFGGIEHWVYSHEFDHAIVDQAYNIGQMQDCPADAQRCQAVKALIEGDAQLLMNQWVKQYATPQDYKDFLSYRPPAMALPEQFPPAYLAYDMNFPYEQGGAFVSYLYKRGNWAGVNRAYANLPASTEQILHPEKYTAGEEPVPVFAPAVETALGGDWQIIANTNLGEWTTYLLLFSGADEAARVSAEESAKAAAGWGGDHYQVYYSPSADQTALAAQWAWDSEKDAQEFHAALKSHLHELYRGQTIEQPGADCWEVNNQATCFITRPTTTLWLTAPDLAKIKIMWDQYADFK